MSQAAYAFNRGKKSLPKLLCLNLQHARLMTDLLTPDIQRSGFFYHQGGVVQDQHSLQ